MDPHSIVVDAAEASSLEAAFGGVCLEILFRYPVLLSVLASRKEVHFPRTFTILNGWQKNIRMPALRFVSFLKRTRPMELRLS